VSDVKRAIFGMGENQDLNQKRAAALSSNLMYPTCEDIDPSVR